MGKGEGAPASWESRSRLGGRSRSTARPCGSRGSCPAPWAGTCRHGRARSSRTEGHCQQQPLVRLGLRRGCVTARARGISPRCGRGQRRRLPGRGCLLGRAAPEKGRVSRRGSRWRNLNGPSPSQFRDSGRSRQHESDVCLRTDWATIVRVGNRCTSGRYGPQEPSPLIRKPSPHKT